MAVKKVIISENQLKRLVIEETMSKVDIASLTNSKEFKDAIRKALENNRDVEKDIEKKVRKIVADSVSSLFRGLWERNSFWRGIITNS